MLLVATFLVLSVICDPGCTPTSTTNANENTNLRIRRFADSVEGENERERMMLKHDAWHLPL